MTTPAGWYPDAEGQQRYWDGEAWTEHVAPAEGAQAQPPAAAGAPPTAGYGAANVAPYAVWPPTEYLEGAGSDFQGAIKNAFANITTWEGRASRSSYWWFALFTFIVGIVVYAFLLAIKIPAAIFVLDIVLFLAGLAVGIRRLHDTDRSGWWILIDLVPCVGFIILIIFFVMPGTPGPNQYSRNVGGPGAPA